MTKGTACGGDRPQDLSPYGYKWQCVEFVRRFHATNNGPNVWNRNNSWPTIGSAYADNGAYHYLDLAASLGLAAIPNGDTRRPQPDDILVFNRATTIGDTFGHVAIVTGVTDAGVTVVEQNWSTTGYKFLPRDTSRSGYFLADRGSYPIRGWLTSQGLSVVATDVPRSIPDPGQTISSLDVTATGTIVDVNLFFQFTHQCERDLRMVLRAPSGSFVSVMDRGLERCSGVATTFISDNRLLGR